MEDNNSKLFVGNLSYNVTEEQLSEAFSALEGIEVTEAKVISDKFTGKPRGFGFVTVATPEMAQKAIELMNNQELDGRQIFVNISRPQTDRGNDHGGRGNFGGGSGGNRSFDRRDRRF